MNERCLFKAEVNIADCAERIAAPGPAVARREGPVKEQEYARLTKRGYVIVDVPDRNAHFHTLSSNRKDAWDKFCPPEMRASWRKNGMQCVYVELVGGFWFKPMPESVK